MEYDVFISCKSEDYREAETIYNFLTAQGVKVFFAPVTLSLKGNAAYREEIDEAIDRVKNMIVYASEVEYVLSQWVKHEWDLFLNEKWSGRKDGNLITVLKGLKAAQLPISLRNLQSFDFADYKGEIMAFVKKTDYLTSDLEQKIENIRSAEKNPKKKGKESKSSSNDETKKLYNKAKQKISCGTSDKNKKEGLELMKQLADTNYTKALISIGDCYFTGEIVEKNLPEAYNWYLKAFHNKDYNLATLLLKIRNCYKEGFRDINPEIISEAIDHYKSVPLEGDSSDAILNRLYLKDWEEILNKT
ncbi:MAG: toll/interleukin-1 receptor domain-containing protein [Muribaculaceae bacterium]|nr:toll/interleukin-1 receptor domain-containing protein [Muribaculaceae bacterium]